MSADDAVFSVSGVGQHKRRSPPTWSTSSEHTLEPLPKHLQKRKSLKDLVKDAYFMARGEEERGRYPRNKQRATAERLLTVFRRVANIAVFCIRQCKFHSFRNSKEDVITTAKHPSYFNEDALRSTDSGLFFDASLFRANKQDRISEETKRTLAKSPNRRTEQEIFSAQMVLRCNKAFAEYPVRMQRKIVEVGKFERYEAKRVIVRQGHPAASFYFILSGTVVVTVMDEARKYAHPVAYLHRGQTFGELAIIHRGTRQSTIVAKEDVEFLTISVEDFHNIFMDGGVKNLNDPDHIRFLRSLHFLNGWPIHLLAKYPQKCVFHFFKRGELLVKDSQFSGWIIIVKSGSLTVVKKLQSVLPFQWKKTSKSREKAETMSQISFRKIAYERNIWRRSVLPDLKIPLRVHSVDTEEEIAFPQPFRKMQHDIHLSLSEKKAPDVFNMLCLNGRKKNFKLMLPPIKQSRVSKENLYMPICHSGENSDVAIQEPRKKPRQDVPNILYKPYVDLDKTGGKSQKEHSDEKPAFHQHIRTINEDLDSGRNRKETEDSFNIPDTKSDFVRVQTLTKGQVFGLTDIIFGQQSSFSVISNGAECILIDKGLYRDHASEGLLRQMRQELSPYPSDSDLQTELQTKVDWESFKEITLRRALMNVRHKRNTVEIIA